MNNRRKFIKTSIVSGTSAFFLPIGLQNTFKENVVFNSKGKKHFWSVIPAWRKTRFGISNAPNTNLEK